MRRLLGRLVSPGMVVALIALFVALGGVGYAKGVVRMISGSKIKKGSIQLNRLSSKALAALKGNQGPAGSAGSQGLPGGQGPQGLQGTQGQQGAQGPAGPFPATLPSGKTLTGAFILIGAPTGAAAQTFENPYTFAFPLSSAPTPHITFAPTTECPGSYVAPTAAPGNLCIYPNHTNTLTLMVRDPTTNNGPASGTMGFFLSIESTGAGSISSDGTWAVTAP